MDFFFKFGDFFGIHFNFFCRIGFKKFTTIPDLVDIFPELDYVDHTRRKMRFEPDLLKAKQMGFEAIEAIVLLGEPVNWERALQIIIDVLMTNGDPRSKPADPFKAHHQLPVIACNKDLTFKGAARLPRFGHGAFLECLEHLYQVSVKQKYF
jgi:ribonucleotide monophosphatase NagD (HAD superfamily)